MRRVPYIILVCLLVLFLQQKTACAKSSNSIQVVVQPQLGNAVPSIDGQSLGSGHARVSAPSREADVSYIPANANDWDQPSAYGRRGGLRGFSKPIHKVKPPACTPVSCAPACTTCILCRRLPGQWEIDPQLFYARVRGTTQWPVLWFGVPASEVDLNDDLGISGHQYLAEYTARYQFRPNWALHYSIMPFETNQTFIPNQSFTFGQQFFSAFQPVTTRWQFVYQRVGLIYQPIVTPYSILSVFNYWTYNNQQLRVSSQMCLGTCATLDRSRNMIMSGIELQRCIRTLPNGGTLSCDTRVGIGYLDDTVLLDLLTGFQFSVPMNAGRWGYCKGGYRFIDWKESRNELRLDTAFEGWFAEAGLIF